MIQSILERCLVPLRREAAPRQDLEPSVTVHHAEPQAEHERPPAEPPRAPLGIPQHVEHVFERNLTSR